MNSVLKDCFNAAYLLTYANERKHVLNCLYKLKQYLYNIEAMNDTLLIILKQIHISLPNNRDWLDPHIEKNMKTIINRAGKSVARRIDKRSSELETDAE